MHNFTIVFFLSFGFNLSIFWISTAHELKAHFVTPSVVTSHKWDLTIQIGQALQFCVHSISANYHILRLHTFEGETFGSFDVLIGYRGVMWVVTMEKQSKIFLESSIISFISFWNRCLKETKLQPQEFQKFVCPRNLLAPQLEKTQHENVGKKVSVYCLNIFTFVYMV